MYFSVWESVADLVGRCSPFAEKLILSLRLFWYNNDDDDDDDKKVTKVKTPTDTMSAREKA